VAPFVVALTSKFAALGPFVHQVAAGAGLSLEVHEPLMTNSDHANFAAHGIPAMRLLAGFNDSAFNLRHLLTGAARPFLTNSSELKASTLTAGPVLWRALEARSINECRPSTDRGT